MLYHVQSLPLHCILSLTCYAGSQDEEVLILHKTSHLAIWRFPAFPSHPVSTTSQAQASDSTSAPNQAEHGVPWLDASRQASSASAGTSAEIWPTSEGDSQAEATDPQLMAFTTLRFKAYSAARSPDGRLLAAGKASLVLIWFLKYLQNARSHARATTKVNLVCKVSGAVAVTCCCC